MALVASGLLNKQVGGELGISEITVKAHRGNVDAQNERSLVRASGQNRGQARDRGRQACPTLPARVKCEPFVMQLNGVTPRPVYKLDEIRVMLDLQRPTSESASPHAAVEPSAFDAASADGARLGAA